MKDIPLASADLIADLQELYKPRVIGALDIATEESRLLLAVEQGKVELVQDLARKLKEQGKTDQA